MLAAAAVARVEFAAAAWDLGRSWSGWELARGPGGWVVRRGFFLFSAVGAASSGTIRCGLYRARRDPNSYSNPGIRIVLLYIYI